MAIRKRLIGSSGPCHQLLKVDLVTIEVGSVDTGESGPSVDRDAAGAAHSRPVHHDGVEAHQGLDAEGTCRLYTGIHHGQGADGHDQVRGGLLQDLAKRLRHQTRSAIAAVIGADRQLVTMGAESVLPEDQCLATESDDAPGVVSRLFEGA